MKLRNFSRVILLLSLYSAKALSQDSLSDKKTKCPILTKEYLATRIQAKYNPKGEKQELLPDTDCFYFKNLQEIYSGYGNKFPVLKMLNQKQILNWIKPLNERYCFNENNIEKIEYKFLSLQKQTRSFISIIVLVGDDSSDDEDIFLVTIDKLGNFLDGVLIFRNSFGMSIDAADYPSLKCNSLEMPPPHIQKVQRISTLHNDTIDVIEKCEILKKNYQQYEKKNATYNVLLKTQYFIKFSGEIIKTVNQKLITAFGKVK